MQRVAWFVSLSLLSVGCFLDGGGDDTTSFDDTPRECTSNSDCSALDNDQDVCTRVECVSFKCVSRFAKDTFLCECQADTDCGHLQKECGLATCNGHTCEQKVAPAGPAPEQTPGDCMTKTCDGASVFAREEADANDSGDVPDDCAVFACTASGVEKTPLPDGTACKGGGVCFKGGCMACTPKTTCGEGEANEPQNDSSTTPAPFAQHQPFCAYANGTDTDWYTFFADDADFSTDILRLEFYSSAPTLEVCAYVKCQNGGTPLGGCSSKLPGPNGSVGCCWSGAPSTVKPVWDVDCTDTTEDSGTVYLSIKAPGATSCEMYAVSGGY